MVSQKTLIQEIHTEVALIKQHIEAQNDKVFKNTEKIDKMEPKLQEVKLWDKLKTIGLIFFSGVSGSMATYIFLT